MSEFWWLKFIGTPSDDPDFVVATAGEGAESIELAVIAVRHDHPPEGDETEYLGGVLDASKIDRLILEVKFVPFSNIEDSEWPQNSDTLLQYRAIRKIGSLWITRPTTEGREAPPRYQNSTAFPLTYALLPVRVVPKPLDSSMVEDSAWTEVSQVFRAREVSI